MREYNESDIEFYCHVLKKVTETGRSRVMLGRFMQVWQTQTRIETNCNNMTLCIYFKVKSIQHDHH